MTYEGLGEMFEGDSADACGRKFPLVSIVGRAEGLACADPVARTHIVMSGNFLNNSCAFNEKLQRLREVHGDNINYVIISLSSRLIGYNTFEDFIEKQL